MQQHHKTEFGKQYDYYSQSREMEIYRNLGALEATFQVFQRNFDELMNVLEPLKDTRESLITYNQEKMENVDALITETKRLLHNFLASAQSLVDHTRVIVNKLYEGHEFRSEYQNKLDQDLAKNPVKIFVQNLRNYTLHYVLPTLNLQIHFSSDDLKFYMNMDIEVLKKWDGWKSSRSYLESFEDNLCIATLASEYYILIQNFYNWLTSRQEKIHQADFENLRKMEEKLMKMEEQIINRGSAG